MSIVNPQLVGLKWIMTPFNRAHPEVLGLQPNELGEKPLFSATDDHACKGSVSGTGKRLWISKVNTANQIVSCACWLWSKCVEFWTGIIEFAPAPKNTFEKIHFKLTCKIWGETLRGARDMLTWKLNCIGMALRNSFISLTTVCGAVIYRQQYLMLGHLSVHSRRTDGGFALLELFPRVVVTERDQ